MSKTGALSILACQLDIPPMASARERDTHLAVSAAKVSAHLERQSADIVVLPELSSIDYARRTFDRLDEISEPLDGASFAIWQKVAKDHGVFVCYSFARRDDTGTYISIAVVNPLGEMTGYYDKLHLAQYGASMEKEYFQRGDHLLVFEVAGFKLATLICYDIRIPELSRTLAVDHGAEVLLHCGAYYRDASFHTWQDFAVTRAVENQVFFLSLNRAGKTYGHSLFCTPWMDEDNRPTQFHRSKEDFRLIKVERSHLTKAREEYSFLKDRLHSYALPIQRD